MSSGKENPVIVLVIVLALAGYGLWLMKTSPEPVVDDTTTNPVVKIPDYTNPDTPISYGDALIRYKDARIQLDSKCQATPNNITYKNGTNIMIDNRAEVARKVKVGSTYSIEAYGFKIIKLSSSVLPVTWFVDCGASQNVATILIQR